MSVAHDVESAASKVATVSSSVATTAGALDELADEGSKLVRLLLRLAILVAVTWLVGLVAKHGSGSGEAAPTTR